MTTTEILTGIKNWVVGKLNLKQNVISDLADIRSGAQAGATSIQPADIVSYFDNAAYDSGTHRINFYHGQSVIAYIDASPFIVDGMVDDVRIENGYLVVDFNTASGKQDISIPLTDIFNPNNYYTKSETDSRLTQKQSEIDDLYARIGYYVCSTEGNVAAKTIVANNYTLGNGGSIKVKMTNANTVNNATLNINSTGAKALYYDGERASAKNSWEAGETVEVYYDGTSYYANNVAGGSGSGDGAFDVSVKYPTSGVDGGNTYTLEGALAVLNANLSASKKKGGMSIKFIHSYDNKYAQYKLMDDDWSTVVTDWSFCGDDVLVENPEWIYVLLDSQKRILAGLKSDGSVEWSIGIPTPVKTYIDNAIAEIKNGTEGTDLDGLNKIIAFLSEFSTSDTLKDLLDTKVDKEEGKSLINAEYANGVHYVENPEFAEVKVDNEDRILEAIMKDGTKLLPAGVKVIGTAEYDGATIKAVENPEFAGVWLDGDDKILFGVEQDGNFLFGCGVPNQIKEYIEQKIEELSLDEYESIVTFIGEYLNNTTLEELLSKKVDGEYVDNPEYIEAKIDAEDKVLEGIKIDGTKIIGGDLKILGNIEVSGVSYKVIENPEYLAAWVDAEDKVIFGIKTDGKTYVGDADFLDDVESIKVFLSNFNDKDIDWDALTSIIATENPEFIEVELDADDKVLSGRKTDGTKFENNDVELNGNVTVGGSLEVDGVVIKNSEDPENRSEITLDSEDKIISYRKDDGTLVENSGIETNRLELTEQGMSDFQQSLKDNGFKPASIDIKYNLPKYGTVNIKQETFYLSQGNYTDKNDIEVRQELPDTDENAAAKLTIAHYYIKDTNTRLDFYAAGQVTKVENKYYVISSLGEGGVVVSSSIEVTQIIDKPDVRTWPVDKKTEHYCLVDINFGHYLTKSDISIGVKFQGASTLNNRKRNFRFTFYKSSAKPYYPVDDDKFGKKDKIKIGELLRLSGFNLKSNWTDNSRIKELILYRIFIEVWKLRPDTDRFPWDKEFGFYTGATGIINGFPIKTLVGEDFYGTQTFGLKKDEKNYMLDGDDDNSGMFVCGTRRDATCWTTATASDWEDEMMDEMSQSTADALNTFFAFINNRLEVDGNIVEFNKENIPERMDVLGWIDYFINMQLFVMHDSICRNMILHTRSDKKKFYPYFYDVDLTLRRGGYSADIFDEAYNIIDDQKIMNDMSLWENFIDLYWDEIVNRYCYLRKTVLNIDYFTAMYHASADAIPDTDYSMENQRWGVNTSRDVFEQLLEMLDKRLAYLDDNYFIV